MKLTTGIFVLTMMAASPTWAQNPDLIQNTRDTMNNLEKKKAIDSNAVLAGAQGPTAPAQSTQAPASEAADSKNATPATTKPSPRKAGASKAATGKVASGLPTTEKPASVKTVSQKAQAAKTAGKPAVKAAAPQVKPVTVPKKSNAQAKPSVAANTPNAEAANAENKPEKKYALTGKRDPFLSPVVSQAGGSGCSTGKKCLDIGQINLRGVVKADAGMIAVVTNSLNKAYFLRENDPVFNGYVVKITGDSIIFKETVQDKLGKSFTRDVTKKIVTPAV
jgi:Tfp pilus assembly protein PilP